MLLGIICLDDENGKTVELIKVGIPVDLADTEIEEVFGGKYKTTKESYSEAKTILITLLKQSTNPNVIRDLERRRREWRAKAAAVASTDPIYAKDLIKDADEPQFKYESVLQLLDDLEFAAHYLNKKSYLILEGKKDSRKKTKLGSGFSNTIASSAHSVFSDGPSDAIPTSAFATTSVTYNAQPSSELAAQAVEELVSPAPIGSIGGEQDF